MGFVIAVLALLALAVVGSWIGVDTRPMDPRDNTPQWPFARYGD